MALVRGLGMRLYNNCVPLCSRDEHYKVELRVPTIPFPRFGIGRDPLQISWTSSAMVAHHWAVLGSTSLAPATTSLENVTPFIICLVREMARLRFNNIERRGCLVVSFQSVPRCPPAVKRSARQAIVPNRADGAKARKDGDQVSAWLAAYPLNSVMLRRTPDCHHCAKAYQLTPRTVLTSPLLRRLIVFIPAEGPGRLGENPRYRQPRRHPI